jgi:hypothetical protein
VEPFRVSSRNRIMALYEGEVAAQAALLEAIS